MIFVFAFLWLLLIFALLEVLLEIAIAWLPFTLIIFAVCFLIEVIRNRNKN